MPSLCPYKAVVMAALQWLVALVVLCAAAQSQGECITGLVDAATLALWSEEYGAPINLEEQSNVQYIFPEIRFRCTGTVTKWIIGAEFNSGGGNIRYPVIGFYRDIGVANQYSRVSRRLFVHPTESFSRLYEYIPPFPQPFQSGDILGLFQPLAILSRLHLLFGEVDGATQSFRRDDEPDFDANGLSPFNATGVSTQTNRLPLVAVEIESDDPDSADCTRDFISRDLLELLLVPSLSERQNEVDGRQFVFPSYNFSCAGLITSWSLGLVEPTGNDARINYPQLQIWRRNISGDVYDRIATTELTAIAESPNELYSVTIDLPLQFQSGDLLGMFLPSDEPNNGRLRVLFGQNAGPTYLFADSAASLTSLSVDGDSDNDSPFLALEILCIVSPPSTLNSTTTAMSPPTTAVTSASPPTTGEASATPPTELLPVIAIAVGASVGGVALAAVVIVLIIVTAVACARKKNQNPTDRSVDAINMTATAEETYDYPFHEPAAVATKRNKAYATTAITTEQNEAYASTAITTEQNEAYASTAITTEQNEAYASTAITTEQNEAYATTAITTCTEQNETHGGTTAADEYEYI